MARAPRRFFLARKSDETGKSGEGVVAFGVVFHDGETVLRWVSDTPSTVHYRSVDQVEEVHGHDGKTVVTWIDEKP